jgi:hypothetical protein
VKPSLASLFPIKLLMAYIYAVSLFPFLDYLTVWDNCEAFAESQNLWLLWDIILCVPFLPVVFLAIRHFRQMPFFAGFMIFATYWQMTDALMCYLGSGFRPDFDFNLDPLGFLLILVIFAIPFIAIYLIWRFWPRRQAEVLPAQ